jgi:hypothetical protein
MGRQEMHTEFRSGNLSGSDLEDQEGDGRITLRWILGKQIVRKGGRWNWPRNMSIFWLCISCGVEP